MKKFIVIVVILIFVAGVFWAFRAEEYDRSESPDGKYVAIAKYHAFRSWIPMMPGGSGDKPGWLILSSKDGKIIASQSLEMVSFIKNIRWSDHSAEIPVVGEWQLN